MNIDHKLLELIEALANRRGLVYLAYLTEFFAIGPLEVLVAYPEWFASFDTSKILLLSVAITLPVTLAIVLARVLFIGGRISDEEARFAFMAGTPLTVPFQAGAIFLTRCLHGGFLIYFIACFLCVVAMASASFDERAERKVVKADASEDPTKNG
jgi:hypothetical protein